MNRNEIVEHLASKGVKPTANRIIVLKALHEANRPMSLKALEMKLLSMDKSSIFRVLTLFLEHEVVHSFEDGRGLLPFLLRDMPTFVLLGRCANARCTIAGRV